MDEKNMPEAFRQLREAGCIRQTDVRQTRDGFWVVYKSVADILSCKGIREVLNGEGERLACASFFDDWFLYAVSSGGAHTYSLLKLREQERDARDGAYADGDTPGVTVCFIRFAWEALLACLAEPTPENRSRLNGEINRVVARGGQTHHPALKRYFMNPASQGAYLVAQLYTGHIAAFAREGRLRLPEHYKQIVKQHQARGGSKGLARLPDFMEALSRKAGAVLCDREWLYIQDPANPTRYEAAAILATHTGNTSVYSFAAEVEYHARFLTPLAKIKLPFLGSAPYASAVRADMSVGDAEFQGLTPFYRDGSRLVKRQCALHQEEGYNLTFAVR